MMNFRRHDNFNKELAVLEKRRLRHIEESLRGFQNLCEVHFSPTNPQGRIAPGKLHCVSRNDSWAIWKTELPVIKSGLRPNQYPRIWFVVSGGIIAFLCVASHIDNYKDNDMDKLAISRASDIF